MQAEVDRLEVAIKVVHRQEKTVPSTEAAEETARDQNRALLDP